MESRKPDGVTPAHEEIGSGSPPLLLVHGWCTDHTLFAPQIEFFGRNHRVVAVDLRGHGVSDAPRQDDTMAGFAWIGGELGLERPIVVGHSIGGTTACPCRMTAQTLSSGHFSPLEVPDQIHAMISRFLSLGPAREGLA